MEERKTPQLDDERPRYSMSRIYDVAGGSNLPKSAAVHAEVFMESPITVGWLSFPMTSNYGGHGLGETSFPLPCFPPFRFSLFVNSGNKFPIN
jgi:hypothetical protein